jgi:DNA-binding CsgD family transcriptional regulator
MVRFRFLVTNSFSSLVAICTRLQSASKSVEVEGPGNVADRSMLHVSFAMYVLSLLSGVLLLSALGNHPKYRCAAGFREFIALYLLITAFVCVTALCLYLSVNVSTADGLRQQVFKIYFTVILLFLALLPGAMEKYDSTLYRFTAPSWFTGFRRFCVLYAVAGAIIAWWLGERWYLPVIGVSIALFIVALVAVSRWSRPHYDEIFKGRTARFVSRAMVAQSLGLPFVEGVFWPEHLARDGFTFSLPVLFMVNNALLWIWRDEMMPGAGDTVPLANMESLLSPKEQEVARALAEGLSNKQIAAKLGIAESTVKNHIYSIFRKCKVTNRIGLVYYLRAG